MNWILDPRLFNYIILILFALAAIRWGYEGKWGDCLYWVSAIGLNAAVTWGYQR
jgi:hypothetical protein